MTSREIVDELNNINKEYNQDIIRKAANKIEELRKYIDDSTNDHFTDTLEYYADRCHRLDCEIDILRAETPHISRVAFCRALETLKRNEDFYDELNEVFVNSIGIRSFAREG